MPEYVLNDTPVNGSEDSPDLLSYLKFVTPLAKLIINPLTQTPLTIGIYGKWGVGKTSVMQMMRTYLKKENCKTIWFNPWKYDEKDLIWKALIQTIWNQIQIEKRFFEIDIKQIVDAKNKLTEQGINILSRVVGAGEVGTELKNLFTLEPLYVNTFESKFCELVQGYTKEARLVIFIDDLDRCTPENAIKVLEAIKLYLEAKNCVFVIGVENEVIEKGLTLKYGQQIDIKGDKYLEKIIQIPFTIPRVQDTQIKEFIAECIKKMGLELGKEYVEVVAKGTNNNPREIKRFLNTFLLVSTMAKSAGRADLKDPLLAKLLVLELRWPDFYQSISTMPALIVDYEEVVGILEEERRDKYLKERKFLAKYFDDKDKDKEDLREFIKSTGSFEQAGVKGAKEIEDYLYFTQSTARKTVAPEPELEEKDLDRLLSGDKTKVESVIEKAPEDKSGYVGTLLKLIKDERIKDEQRLNIGLALEMVLVKCNEEIRTQTQQKLVENIDKESDLEIRIAYAEALGRIGDTRMGDDKMVELPKGKFWRGTPDKIVEELIKEYNWQGFRAETPQQQIELSAFRIDKYPVTNYQFAQFIKADGYATEEYWTREGWSWKKENKITKPAYGEDSKWNKPDYPVVGVSWYEASAYAKWAGKRLPTEEEWEKSARGKEGLEYPWGNDFDKDKCNTSEGRVGKTTPVGIYPQGSSPYGVMDMAGNVWEWCADWYKAYPGSTYKSDNFGEKYKVLRGGSWDTHRLNARCASRYYGDPDTRLYDVGFRCAQ